MQSADLIRQAGRTFAGVNRIDASRFRFLNLDDFQPRFGSAWPQARSSVFERCEAFIARRLGPGDILLRAANGFLVLRAPGQGGDPAAFTRRLERELKTFFLGEDHFGALEVCGVSESVDASELLGALSDPALDAAEAAWSAQSGPDAPPRRVDIEFQPVWCASSRRPALCFTASRPASPALGPDRAWAADGCAARQEAVMEHDLEVFKQVRRALDASARLSDAIAVAASVHFSTLSSPRTRMAYAAMLADQCGAGRTALLLRIIKAPSDAPSGRYAQVAFLARRLARRAFLDVGLAGFRPERFIDAPFDAFILTAPHGEGRLPVSDNGFQRFLAGVKRLGSAWGVDGCWSADEAQAYVTAGALFVAGPWLQPGRAAATPSATLEA